MATRVQAQPHGGPDGADIEAGVGAQLDHLSRLCAELGVPDPVEEYFAPVVGRWSDLHAEAERWRSVGAVAEQVGEDLTKPLGGLDAAWRGADADSFIDYINGVGLAGNDMADAMTTMGAVLDETADGLREIVLALAEILAEASDTAGQAVAQQPVGGADRARLYLDHMRRPTRELFESVRQVLEALVRLCEGVDGSTAFDQVTMAHKFPEDDWAFDVGVAAVPPGTAKPSVPAAAAAAPMEPLKAGGGGGGGGGFGGGGGAVDVPAQAPQAGGYVTAGEALPSKPGGMPAAAPAAAAAAAEGGRGGMGGMPMMPMGGMMGQGGGANEHKPRNRVTADPEDIFGKPMKASPSVIGDD